MKRLLLVISLLLTLSAVAAAQTPMGGVTGPSSACSTLCSSVLDDFNRSNAGPPLGGSWSGTKVVTTHSSTLKISSNKATGGSVNTNSEYWATSFGANQGAYFTLAGGTNDFKGVFLRLANPGTTGVTGYWLRCQDGSQQVFRLDAPTANQIGTTLTHAMAVGDGCGMKIVGSTLTIYYRSGTGGAWTQLTTITDSTYSNAGYIGMSVTGDTTFGDYADDFGGGAES